MRELCQEALALMGRLALAQEDSITPVRFEPIIERAMQRWQRRVSQREAAETLCAEIAEVARTTGRMRGMPICYTLCQLRESLEWVRRQQIVACGSAAFQLRLAADVLELAIAHRERRPMSAWMPRDYWDREAVGFRARMRTGRRR